MLATRNQGWDWLFGLTPAFTVRLPTRAGDLLELVVTGGLVEFAKLNKDVHIRELEGQRFELSHMQTWLQAH